MKKQHQADLALLLVTVGWGASFILTKNALKDLDTFNFLALRFLSAFFISALVFIKRFKSLNKRTLISSIIIGTILFTGYALQTIGLHYTSVSKSAFITGFAVVLVPMFTSLMNKQWPEKSALLGSLYAFIGIGLLSLNDASGPNIGDLLTLIAAIAFAYQIITVGIFTDSTDSLLLGILQIGVVGMWSLFATFMFESPVVPTGVSLWTNLLILSIVCTCGAFITQSVAQQYTTATHTALIYSGEPVFASIFAYFWVGEMLSTRGLIGAGLILTGMLVAELDLKALLKGNKEQLRAEGQELKAKA